MDLTGQNKIICTTCKRGKKFKVYFFDQNKRKDYVLECPADAELPFDYDYTNNVCTFNITEEFDLPFYENENYQITFPLEAQRDLWKALVDNGFKRVK